MPYYFLLLLVVSLSLAPIANAADVYVSDRLFLGVTELPQSGQKAIVTLKNGTKMELLERQERYSRVRLEDGQEGWVRNLFISDTLPASQQVPTLEADKASLQAQIEQLKKDMLQREQEQVSPQEMFTMNQEKLALQKQIDESKTAQLHYLIAALVLSCVTLILGFVWGYGTLAKRVKQKFNGMKVW